MKNYSSFTLGLLLLLVCTHAGAKGPRERVELMKYAIKVESALRHESKWEVSWWEKLRLIEEAYAYKEGETCLVLGFKSQFKNGMCRLSAAEDLKDYKKECAGGYLPCNPKIFGKPSSDKPFCVSQSSGSELSKSCAKETFTHLANKTKAPELKDIPALSVKKFDLNTIDLSQMSPELVTEFNSVFNHEDSSLEAAVKFTEGLCEDLKISTQSGHQPFDLKTCEGYLDLLKKGVVREPDKEIEKVDNQQGSEGQQVTDEKSDIVVPVVEKKKETTDEECIEPVLNKTTEENIIDVQQVTKQGNAAAMMSCINQIKGHSIVAKQLKGIEQSNKERDRYYGYWHQLDGEKQFGRMCETTTEDTARFAFLGPQGYVQVSVPVAHIKEQMSLVSYNGEKYYLARDMLGDYFELINVKKVSSAPKEAQEDIKLYHKRGGKGVDAIVPTPADKIEEASSCIRSRIYEYVDWITYPYGILPNAKEYNADIHAYNASLSSAEPGAGLKAKYSRTVNEIKKQQFADLMKEAPDCVGILSEDDFSKNYDKDHADRIRLYNQFRTILKLN